MIIWILLNLLKSVNRDKIQRWHGYQGYSVPENRYFPRCNFKKKKSAEGSTRGGFTPREVRLKQISKWRLGGRKLIDCEIPGQGVRIRWISEFATENLSFAHSLKMENIIDIWCQSFTSSFWFKPFEFNKLIQAKIDFALKLLFHFSCVTVFLRAIKSL